MCHPCIEVHRSGSVAAPRENVPMREKLEGGTQGQVLVGELRREAARGARQDAVGRLALVALGNAQQRPHRHSRVFRQRRRHLSLHSRCMLVAGRERESEGSRLKKSTFLRSNNLLRLPKLLHVDILSFITVIYCKHSSFEKTAVIVPMLVTDSCAGRGE